MTRSSAATPLSRQLVAQLPSALRKLDPRHLWRSPVMFIVWIGSLVTTVSAVVDPSGFTVAIAAWLWLTRRRDPEEVVQ